MILRRATSRGSPLTSLDTDPLLGGRVQGWTLKAWACTCLYWSEEKDNDVQNVVVIVHVTFTQARQSGENFNGKASFPEGFRQAVHLFFPMLSLYFQNF